MRTYQFELAMIEFWVQKGSKENWCWIKTWSKYLWSKNFFLRCYFFWSTEFHDPRFSLSIMKLLNSWSSESDQTVQTRTHNIHAQFLSLRLLSWSSHFRDSIVMKKLDSVELSKCYTCIFTSVIRFCFDLTICRFTFYCPTWI